MQCHLSFRDKNEARTYVLIFNSSLFINKATINMLVSNFANSFVIFASLQSFSPIIGIDKHSIYFCFKRLIFIFSLLIMSKSKCFAISNGYLGGIFIYMIHNYFYKLFPSHKTCSSPIFGQSEPFQAFHCCK